MALHFNFNPFVSFGFFVSSACHHWSTSSHSKSENRMPQNLWFCALRCSIVGTCWNHEENGWNLNTSSNQNTEVKLVFPPTSATAAASSGREKHVMRFLAKICLGPNLVASMRSYWDQFSHVFTLGISLSQMVNHWITSENECVSINIPSQNKNMVLSGHQRKKALVFKQWPSINLDVNTDHQVCPCQTQSCQYPHHLLM